MAIPEVGSTASAAESSETPYGRDPTPRRYICQVHETEYAADAYEFAHRGEALCLPYCELWVEVYSVE
ncbi:hypothetical protein HDU67_006695 [Dinochytrium kinnereticum]|nr:hypothetical protein HDU67_006695 [Dinochytrium kinnereticum]